MTKPSLFLLFLFAMASLSRPASAGSVITDLHTDQALYRPCATVRIFADLAPPPGRAAVRVTIGLTCTHLGTPVGGPAPRTVRLVPGAAATVVFRWNPPATNGQGYSVEAWARGPSGRLLDCAGTAVDVSSTWTRFPRYGFLSEFPPQAAAVSQTAVGLLNKYHLNALQFYDWQYKHHQPLAGTVAVPASLWNDLANRPISRRTVLSLIASAHRSGMAAMNYNLLYGAWPGYDKDGVDYRWGLWKDKTATRQDSLLMPSGWAAPALYLFNPGDPGWQAYLSSREQQVFASYPFDGWQVDQVGDRGEEYDAFGRPVTVWQQFRPFLNRAKLVLHKTLVFNNVGGYGLYDTAAHSTEDVVYVECWEWSGQKTYGDLRTVIGQAASWSGGKAVVLAAYINRKAAEKFSAGRPGRFNPPGVLLADAAIFASGGAHIEMGDSEQLLNNEYFPNHSLVPSGSLRRALRRYYDFLTAYETLLRGGLADSPGPVTLGDIPSSTDAAPDTVWAFAKSGHGFHVLHLINLCGEKNTDWRDDRADYPPPTPLVNIPVKCYGIRGAIRDMRWASPDRQTGASSPLKFTVGMDTRGRYVRFIVPHLDYWDMVYFAGR